MPPSTVATTELAASLLAANDSAARAALLAAAIVDLLPDSACILHRVHLANDESDSETTVAAIAFAGSVSVDPEIPLASDGPLIAPLFAEPAQPLLYAGADLEREHYAHLRISRTFLSLAYIPLLNGEDLVGFAEVLSFSAPLRQRDFTALAPMLQLAAPAILAAEDFESQRQNLLDSVHRMSQLYDLEKSLNATLELDAVMELIPEKAIAMLPSQAIHLWLFQGDVLRLVSSIGDDETVEVGMLQASGQGYVADMAEEGEPLLIADPEDERLTRRNAVLTEQSGSAPIGTVLLVPLMQDEAEIGVLEAINKADGTAYDEDDQFFLSAMAETVANALKNSSLMHAERKLEILETLVHISSEITSTLRLDRLLQIIVNSPQNVLPFERSAIALDNRGRLQLKAISGLPNIPLGDVQVDRLHELVRWLSDEPEAVHLRQPHDEDGSNLPEPVRRHFEATGHRALYSLPLSDDQGRVGLLLYEASDPDFLDLPHTEMIKILAGQATVAIRNALLYREVPLIGLLEPLMQRKQALLRTTRSRRLAYGAVSVAVLLFLFFCPLPMRVTGDAVVAPQHLVTVAAPVEGNVGQVYAQEGQHVAAGELLGSMNDWQWRTELTSAEAKYRATELTMQASLARGSAQAGADRAQTEFLRSEVARARTRLLSAQLRSPIAGIVATPALQNAAGEHLDAGATFAQILDLSSAVVDVAVPQADIALVAPGQPTAIKLDSYPQRGWHGNVDVVSALAQPGAPPNDGDRNFAARVPLPNSDAMLRAGMTGHAKIFIGYRPAGYVLLRKPALWLWQTLWNWIGW